MSIPAPVQSKKAEKKLAILSYQSSADHLLVSRKI
jgi:hypothetical protein